MKMTIVASCAMTLVVAVVGTALVLGHLSDSEPSSDRVVVDTLASAVLGERREVIVRLPESYQREPARRYPAIYVLDGASQSIQTADSAALMARIGVMPELIVVGVPSGDQRQRDHTPPFMLQDLDDAKSPLGEADRFLAFLKDEVIPRVEREYRTDSLRMLAGHSRGGLLVCYSLLAEPQLFAARFAHSPALWRQDGLLIDKLAEFLSAKPGLESFLYLSLGAKENDKMMAAFERTRSLLAEFRGSGLVWQADLVAGADHSTNAGMATPLGFKALFGDGSLAAASGAPLISQTPGLVAPPFGRLPCNRPS
jgi:predicted alpha/beta superfamily hydrolase